MFEIYHHMGDNEKELMLSQYIQYEINKENKDLNTENIAEGSKIQDIPIDLLEIKFVIDSDREKNIIIKINNLKAVLRLDSLQMMRYFFTEGFPYYEMDDLDLPNQCKIFLN